MSLASPSLRRVFGCKQLPAHRKRASALGPQAANTGCAVCDSDPGDLTSLMAPRAQVPGQLSRRGVVGAAFLQPPHSSYLFTYPPEGDSVSSSFVFT